MREVSVLVRQFEVRMDVCVFRIRGVDFAVVASATIILSTSTADLQLRTSAFRPGSKYYFLVQTKLMQARLSNFHTI